MRAYGGSSTSSSPSYATRMSPKLKLFLALFLLFVLVLIFYYNPTNVGYLTASSSSETKYLRGQMLTVWGESTASEFKVAVVADLDQGSKVEGAKPKWKSIFKRATLKKFTKGSAIRFSVEWEEGHDIHGAIGEEGRGMELSELVHWKGKLYSFDDRTGIVFEILPSLKVIPKHILMEGNGDENKGQKTEWATIKDGKMYIGSFGKEYVNQDGTIKNRNNLWVSIIDENGAITHEDWTKKYDVLREATSATWPGYMIHEAIRFDEINRKWVVLPRRVSSDKYDEKLDERRGSNLVLILDEDFTRVERKFPVGPMIPLRGWSSFEFFPKSKNDIVVALKTEEEENKVTGKAFQRSFITVFRLSDGEELMEQTPIPGNFKFEGVAFL